MKPLAGVTGLVAIALGLCVWAVSQPPSAAARIPEPRAPSESSSRLLGGRIRCTATVNPNVEVGRAVSVGFTLRNVTKRPVTLRLWVFSAGIVLHAADDGSTYDSSAPYENFAGIPPPSPTKLRPGATRRLWPIEVPVRWGGPLRITPDCLGKALPDLHVNVTVPGPPLDDVGDCGAVVVASSGHLLDRCRPQTPGVAVLGQIYPPSGNAPPMNAACSVSITSKGSFSVAQVLVVTPPGLAAVQIYQPYETLWPNGRTVPLASNPPYEAIAWEFVVTSDGATPVAASTEAASKSSTQTESFWGWNGTGFEQEGSGTCGGTSFSWGGTGPYLEFISLCPA